MADKGCRLSGRPKYRMLVVDDDRHQIELVRQVLCGLNLEIAGAPDKESGLQAVRTFRPHAMLLDLVMPGVKGMEMLMQIHESCPDCDVFLMTAHYSMESAVEAIQKGAYDYLAKPIPIARLLEKIEKWLEDAEEKQSARELEAQLVDASSFEGIVGYSTAMREVFSKIRRIAPHYSTVLLTGDTGTGKELVARVLHQLSPVAAGPLVICNCAAIAEGLFESELFGHVRGAFTGATQDKAGFLERAGGGTLFLDEIGEIPLAAQAKLLRAIQNREVQRLGGRSMETVNVRMIAATNRKLWDPAGRGSFREDLYYRLSTVEIRLPRLVERQEDIPLLTAHFLKRFSEQYGKPGLKLTRRAEALLTRHSWPGNVRELENALNYGCMMAEGDTIDLQDLPEGLKAQWQPWEKAAVEAGRTLKLDELERKYVRSVVDLCNGSRGRAAELLGIGRATVYRILARDGKAEASGSGS